MNILAVVAHPDDETLGVGGTLAKHIQNGDRVLVCIVADGVRARSKVKSDIKLQINCAKKACSALGINKVVFLGFRDQHLDAFPLLKITKKIEEVVVKFKPDILYTHYYGDLNMDHRITFEAVMVASRPYSSTVKKIMCFETPSSTEWNIPVKYTFAPNVYENIHKTLDLKLKALSEYSKTAFNEVKDFPYPRSVEAVKSLAKHRGSAAGFMSAEAFVLIREIRE